MPGQVVTGPEYNKPMREACIFSATVHAPALIANGPAQLCIREIVTLCKKIQVHFKFLETHDMQHVPKLVIASLFSWPLLLSPF